MTMPGARRGPAFPGPLGAADRERIDRIFGLIESCPGCLTSNRVRVDMRTRRVKCGTCSHEWTSRRPRIVGDLVRAKTSPSVLDGGPGRVVEVSEDRACVSILVPCTVNDDQVRRGQCFWIQKDELEVVATNEHVKLADTPGGANAA